MAHGEPVVISPLDLNQTSPMEARWAEVGAKLQDRGLGIMPDIHGARSVSGCEVDHLTGSSSVSRWTRWRMGTSASCGASGNLREPIMLHQENLFEDAGTLYTRTTR